jgi:hypothetical protein
VYVSGLTTFVASSIRFPAAELLLCMGIVLCYGCASTGVKETFCTKLEGVVVRLETNRQAGLLKFNCGTHGCHLAKVALHDPYGRELPVQNLRTVIGRGDEGGFSVGFGVCTVEGHGDFGTASGVWGGFPLDRREYGVTTRGYFILPSPRMMLQDWAVTCHMVMPNGEELAFLFCLPAEPEPAVLGEDAVKQGVTPEKAQGSTADRVKELERRRAILTQSLDRKPIVPNADGLRKQIEMILEQTKEQS